MGSERSDLDELLIAMHDAIRDLRRRVKGLEREVAVLAASKEEAKQ